MDRCSACPGIKTCVAPDGPYRKNDLLFIGEAPGYDEDKRGIPFVGKTGLEVNDHYLPLAGLRRDDITITNAIKCLPDRPKGKLDLSREKDQELLETCANLHLYNEIAELVPKLLIPMGAFASYAVDPDINLELHHGIPMETRFGMTFPMYHPSQGIHEPKKMLLLRNDWIRLRRFLRNKLNQPVDSHPSPDYREATTNDIRDIDPSCPIACDTESSRSSGPYCLTYSQQPGEGRLIKADSKVLLKQFQKKLDRWESYVYYHNWPYDWTVTEDMDMRFPTKMSIAADMDINMPVPMTRDTMMMVYHLGNLPQGLKPLAYRLLGMKMQDFEDLVKPYSLGRIYDYYRLAQSFTWPKSEEQLRQDPSTGKWKIYKPQSLNTKLKGMFTNLAKNVEKDLLKVWYTWEAHQAEIEEKCGPYVGLDIADVPFEEALHYACRDSDALIRLVPILERMKAAAMSGKLQEHWDL